MSASYRVYLRQQFRLERLQARGQRRSALQDFLGADEPERRVLREPLSVVDILVARQPAVYRLPWTRGVRIRQRTMERTAAGGWNWNRVLARLIGQMPGFVALNKSDVKADLAGGTLWS